MVENQNGCSYILLHSYAHTHTIHSHIHPYTHMKRKYRNGNPHFSPPSPPAVGTVPRLICNSKLRKEHLFFVFFLRNQSQKKMLKYGFTFKTNY